MELVPLWYGAWYVLEMGLFRNRRGELVEGARKRGEKRKEKGGEEGEGKVKILCYNLWLHHFSLAPKKKERMEKILEKIREENFDVLLIQGK